MKRILLVLILSVLTLPLLAADEKGFVSLFDGKTFNGWKASTENTNSFRIVDGAIVANGAYCHLFYVGDPKPFKNFELRVEVMTETNSNGGIYIHTRYQEAGWPKYGFETQVNNSHSDWKRTGSLYDVLNVRESAAQDRKWWTQQVTVQGRHITVQIDGKLVMDYTEPLEQKAGEDFTRKIDEGTFALQAHDPGSVVRYRNIRVKRLD